MITVLCSVITTSQPIDRGPSGRRSIRVDPVEEWPRENQPRQFGHRGPKLREVSASREEVQHVPIILLPSPKPQIAYSLCVKKAVRPSCQLQPTLDSRLRAPQRYRMQPSRPLMIRVRVAAYSCVGRVSSCQGLMIVSPTVGGTNDSRTEPPQAHRYSWNTPQNDARGCMANVHSGRSIKSASDVAGDNTSGPSIYGLRCKTLVPERAACSRRIHRANPPSPDVRVTTCEKTRSLHMAM